MSKPKESGITTEINGKRNVVVHNPLWNEITLRRIELNKIVPNSYRPTQELAILHGFCRFHMTETCKKVNGICYDCQHLKTQVLKYLEKNDL